MPAQVTVPIMGAVEWFGLGFETVYGTMPTDATINSSGVFFRPGSNTLRATPVTEQLLGPSGSFARFQYNSTLPRHLRLPSDRSGQVLLELDYDDVGWILSNLICQPIGIVFAASGGMSFWPMPGAGPAASGTSSPPPSMTTIRNHGLANRDYKIGGCLINKAVFRGQAGQLVTATLDIVGATGGEPGDAGIGQNYDTGDAPTPIVPTFSQAPFIEHIHSDIFVSTQAGGLGVPATTDGYANTGGDVSEWTLTYDNQYDISPSAGGGTLGIRFPTWQSAPLITLEYTHRWSSAKEFNLYHPTAETGRYRYVRLQMSHPTSNAGDGSGAPPHPSKKTLRFDMPAGFFLGDPPTYDGGTGFIEQHVRVEAAGGGTAVTPGNTATGGGGAVIATGGIIEVALYNDTDFPFYVIP